MMFVFSEVGEGNPEEEKTRSVSVGCKGELDIVEGQSEDDSNDGVQKDMSVCGSGGVSGLQAHDPYNTEWLPGTTSGQRNGTEEREGGTGGDEV
jgi:hypothetical protein